MVITRNGVVNRQRVSEISVIGRATQGVKLVNLDEGDTVGDVARVVIDDENDEDSENDENAEAVAEAGEELVETSDDVDTGEDAEADA